MIIVGAGMAGLLAANMLRKHKPIIYEKSKEVPNNHNSVLRFRSSIVGDTLGIPFKKVNMIKTAVPWLNPVADAMAYSFKNTGVRRSDRSITSGLVSEVRYIAPPDLIQQMVSWSGNIYLQREFDFDSPPTIPIISTIPMPFLMQALDYKDDTWDGNFTWTSGATLRARIKDCDAYVSLLVPSPMFNFSRISITGDELFIEIHNQKDIQFENGLVRQAATLLAIDQEQFTDVELKPQKFSKIIPINDIARKRFMHWATVNHNIYSLGRFATWRPSLLLDDLVNDIRLIEKWITQGHKYEVAKVS